MTTTTKIPINFITSSSFKRQEHKALFQIAEMQDGTPIADIFELEFRDIPISEMLTVEIPLMAQAEATKAYCQMRVPCIVEHAGLIFDDFKDKSYPGGLTKPMWNTLGDTFLTETNSKGRSAVAKAVIAYCDGMKTHTFIGETTGHLADIPRGDRKFYWDTVFIPDDPDRPDSELTYAEIVEDSSLGLNYKMTKLSQSGKAMMEFLKFLRDTPASELWQ